MKILVGAFILILLSTGMKAMSTARAEAALFNDVTLQDEYATAIYRLRDMGIIKGNESGKYNPDETITAFQMVVMLERLFGNENRIPADFNPGHYYSTWFATTVADGEKQGYYGIQSKEISFAQGCRYILAARGESTLMSLNDAIKATGYYGPALNSSTEYVLNAAALGYVDISRYKGENSKKMYASLTRGEAAQLIYDALTEQYVQTA